MRSRGIDDKREGKRDKNAQFPDFEASEEFLLEDIRLIEKEDQVDVSQEGAGTDRVECLEGIVDPIHLVGTRVSGTDVIRIGLGMRRERLPSITGQLYAFV